MRITLTEEVTHVIEVFDPDQFVEMWKEEFAEFTAAEGGSDDENLKEFLIESIHQMGARDFLDDPSVKQYLTDRDLHVEVK